MLVHLHLHMRVLVTILPSLAALPPCPPPHPQQAPVFLGPDAEQ